MEAVVRPGQAGRNNSVASAGFGVPQQVAGPAPALAALLALFGVVSVRPVTIRKDYIRLRPLLEKPTHLLNFARLVNAVFDGL